MSQRLRREYFKEKIYLNVPQPSTHDLICRRNRQNAWIKIHQSQLLNVPFLNPTEPNFGIIQIRINDPRSLGSWCIKGTEESTLGKDSSVSLMHHDPSDLGSLILIWINAKEQSPLAFSSAAVINRSGKRIGCLINLELQSPRAIAQRLSNY